MIILCPFCLFLVHIWTGYWMTEWGMFYISRRQALAMVSRTSDSSWDSFFSASPLFLCVSWSALWVMSCLSQSIIKKYFRDWNWQQLAIKPHETLFDFPWWDHTKAWCQHQHPSSNLQTWLARLHITANFSFYKLHIWAVYITHT